MTSVRMKELIRWAYDTQEHQIVGPAWLNDLRFDLSAKSDQAKSEADMRAMLQTLLAERVRLQLHRDKREMPVYPPYGPPRGALNSKSPPATARPASRPAA